MKKPTETALVSACLKALAAIGVWAWRVNSGARVFAATRTAARRIVRMAPAGSPDIMLIVPGSRGQLAGIECKSDGGVWRKTQAAWCAKAEAHGVRYGIVRRVSECLEMVAEWQREWDTDWHA